MPDTASHTGNATAGDIATLVPAVPRFGVLMNKRSGRNRSGVAKVEALLAARPDIPVHRTARQSEAPGALAALAASGVNVLAVNGGDGTLQVVLNVLLSAQTPFARRPLLTILPGGTTNMIAYDLGCARRPDQELQRLLARLDAGTLVKSILMRPVMAASGGDIDGLTHGFFFGAAGVYEGTMANRSTVDAIGGRDGAGPAWRLLATAGKLLVGRDPVSPVEIGLSTDRQVHPRRHYLALFGSTMQRLSLGLYPFWGEQGQGPIRLTAIYQGARGLLRRAPAILRGRPHKALVPSNGYHSQRTHDLALDFTGGLVVDGEIFQAMPGRPIHIETGPTVAFLRG